MRELTVAKAKLRENYSGDIISKAVSKAKRWMISAYGDTDWEQLEDECGIFETILGYCEETNAEPQGLVTFNRETTKK